MNTKNIGNTYDIASVDNLLDSNSNSIINKFDILGKNKNEFFNKTMSNKNIPTTNTINDRLSRFEFIDLINKNKFMFAYNKMKSFFGNNSAFSYQVKKIKLTTNMNEIKELLASDMVICYILAGNDSVEYMLFPFLSAFFHDDKKVTEKEKQDKIKQLKEDFKECLRIAKDEYDPVMRKNYKQGIECFHSNINSVIRPYSF